MPSRFEVAVQQKRAESLPEAAKGFLEGYITGVLQSQQNGQQNAQSGDDKPSEKSEG